MIRYLIALVGLSLAAANSYPSAIVGAAALLAAALWREEPEE